MTNDGSHNYTFDAEGHITAVDSGSTAIYTYNALNQRVQTAVGGANTEFVFSAAGQRVSEWNGSTGAQLKGHYYWGGKPVAFYASGAAHFQHQDWLGTERMRTTYNGAVEGSFTSLPFGDGQTTSGSDLEANHYATLDHDYESDTEHAQFRQESSTQGRWLSPDPYGGSYDFSNPQSFNRYVYVLNNPLASVDPSGLNHCDYWWGCGGYSDCANDPNCSSGDQTSQDGAQSFGSDTLGGDAVQQCPNNTCQTAVNVGTPQAAIQNYVAFLMEAVDTILLSGLERCITVKTKQAQPPRCITGQSVIRSAAPQASISGLSTLIRMEYTHITLQRLDLIARTLIRSATSLFLLMLG